MADIPQYKRTTEINAGGNIPDFQSAMEGVASASWGSVGALGAKVAQSANTEMANQIGINLGKTPHGDLSPPITDFDKTLKESYSAQASATLSLQANDFLYKSQLELANDPNLTLGKIESANSVIKSGLNSVFSQAPSTVRANLENTYNAQLQTQTYNFQNKMLGQQKEKTTDQVNLYAKQAPEVGYNLGKAGNEKGAQSVEQSSTQYFDNAAENGSISKTQAFVNKETVRKSIVLGKLNNEAETAYHNKTYEKFSADLANGVTHKEIPDNERAELLGAVNSNINQIKNMNQQQENLILGQATEKILIDPSRITDGDMNQWKEQLSPQNAQNLELTYVKAMIKHKGGQVDAGSYTSAGSFATLTGDQQNKLFNADVENQIQSANQKGQSLSIGQAQLSSATKAGGAVPSFYKSIQNRIMNGTSQDMEEASAQYRFMMDKGMSDKVPISDKARVMERAYSNARSSYAPEQAREQALGLFGKSKPEEIEALNNAWADQLSKFKKGGVSDPQIGLNLGGLNASYGLDSGLIHHNYPLSNPQVYGQVLLDKFHSYYDASKGDTEVSQQLLKEDVQKSFGQTWVNGKRQTVMYPLEQAAGLPLDGAPVIQDDIHEHLTFVLKDSKSRFDEGNADSYWSVEPRRNAEQYEEARTEKGGLLFKGMIWPDPVKVTQHFKNGKSETYDVVMKEGPHLAATTNTNTPYYGGWDANIKTKLGDQPLKIADPWDDVVSYRPEAKKLQNKYFDQYYKTGPVLMQQVRQMYFAGEQMASIMKKRNDGAYYATKG